MPERIVAMHAAYRSDQGIVDGFLARPLVKEPRAAVVLLHGYRGLDEHQRAVTRRFATEGFVSLSPDLFHGKNPETLEGRALMKTSLDIDGAASRVVDSAAYLHQLPSVGVRKIAVLGFCMGGGLALYALSRSTVFDTGVIFYQSLFPDPEELAGISAPLLCHYGTRDPFTTSEEIELFTSALDRYGKKYEVHRYEGAGHAFLNNPQATDEADRKAADEAFARTCDWLKIQLL